MLGWKLQELDFWGTYPINQNIQPIIKEILFRIKACNKGGSRENCRKDVQGTLKEYYF